MKESQQAFPKASGTMSGLARVAELKHLSDNAAAVDDANLAAPRLHSAGCVADRLSSAVLADKIRLNARRFEALPAAAIWADFDRWVISRKVSSRRSEDTAYWLVRTGPRPIVASMRPTRAGATRRAAHRERIGLCCGMCHLGAVVQSGAPAFKPLFSERCQFWKRGTRQSARRDKRCPINLMRRADLLYIRRRAKPDDSFEMFKQDAFVCRRCSAADQRPKKRRNALAQNFDVLYIIASTLIKGGKVMKLARKRRDRVGDIDRAATRFERHSKRYDFTL